MFHICECVCLCVFGYLICVCVQASVFYGCECVCACVRVREVFSGSVARPSENDATLSVVFFQGKATVDENAFSSTSLRVSRGDRRWTTVIRTEERRTKIRGHPNW